MNICEMEQSTLTALCFGKGGVQKLVRVIQTSSR